MEHKQLQCRVRAPTPLTLNLNPYRHPWVVNNAYPKKEPKILYLRKDAKLQWIVTDNPPNVAPDAYMYQRIEDAPIPERNTPWHVKVKGVYRIVADISVEPDGDAGNFNTNTLIIFVIIIIGIISMYP